MAKLGTWLVLGLALGACAGGEDKEEPGGAGFGASAGSGAQGGDGGSGDLPGTGGVGNGSNSGGTGNPPGGGGVPNTGGTGNASGTGASGGASGSGGSGGQQGMSCGDLAKANNWAQANCEWNGNGACNGQGTPTYDCDYCCEVGGNMGGTGGGDAGSTGGTGSGGTGGTCKGENEPCSSSPQCCPPLTCKKDPGDNTFACLK